MRFFPTQLKFSDIRVIITNNLNFDICSPVVVQSRQQKHIFFFVLFFSETLTKVKETFLTIHSFAFQMNAENLNVSKSHSVHEKFICLVTKCHIENVRIAMLRNIFISIFCFCFILIVVCFTCLIKTKTSWRHARTPFYRFHFLYTKHNSTRKSKWIFVENERQTMNRLSAIHKCFPRSWQQRKWTKKTRKICFNVIIFDCT